VLIRNADIWQHGQGDVRIEGDRIMAMGRLDPATGEDVLDARGGALLPGLHDHHIHLAGLAVRDASIVCGPPEVTSRDELAIALSRPGNGWIRGILYHESVMGLPDARMLDELIRERPLRMQHRGGRMWLLNSRALAILLDQAEPPPGLEAEAGRFTGRLFDEDAWLRGALGSAPPDLAGVSSALARHGVTGLTDMSPANDAAMGAHFTAQRESGSLAQRLLVAGSLGLADAKPAGWTTGPAKLHLHESALPDFDEAVAFIASAHDQGRAVAVHCVTEVELVFALAATEAAGPIRGDRIEHASVAPPELVERIAAMGLHVCAQPHFVAERGDRYLVDVEPRHRQDLYRLASLADAGIALSGGSDAPFGSADPWAAMHAAVSRETAGGALIGKREALTPEAALALYLADPGDLSRQRAIAVGKPANLCLLRVAWQQARERLNAANVRATFVSGRRIDDLVD
jgi:predicted amidohydrolase YtcJ